MELRPLDPAFPIDRQIALDVGPVVLVNVVTRIRLTSALLTRQEMQSL